MSKSAKISIIYIQDPTMVSKQIYIFWVTKKILKLLSESSEIFPKGTHLILGAHVGAAPEEDLARLRVSTQGRIVEGRALQWQGRAARWSVKRGGPATGLAILTAAGSFPSKSKNIVKKITEHTL